MTSAMAHTKSVVSLIALTLFSCAPSSPSATESPNKALDETQSAPINLTISAASSLQNTLDAVDPLFEQAHLNVKTAYNLGGSGSLQKQIEQGAPADIFLSASPKQMDELAQQNLIRPASRQNLLGNQLVLIAPLSSQLTGFQDLVGFPTKAEKLAVGEFNSVPAGQYAQATLTALNLLPSLTPQLVFFGSVRGVLAAVESGNVSAGLVYKTDAQISNKVKVIAIAPSNTHLPILYPIAVLQRSEHPEAAQAYIDFLQTPEAAQIFQRFGFIAPP
ncbi:MAG: molybdate ABC transporter substrate-binding protein [Phormidesmis sp.]